MYDAIIVGARCAGAPTAMLLARKGHRVLLVDRATFPSDIMSGHYIHQPGVAALRRWGLLDKVAATNCPPVTKTTFDLGDFALTGAAPPSDGVAEGYCPRRKVLDKILVDAAAESGAEVREAFSVQELVFDGDRVAGLRGRSQGGPVVTETARVVIGADGPHSMVARAVGAPQYNVRPVYTCGYYTYWSGVPAEGVELYPRGGRFIVALPTNDGLTSVAVIWPREEFHEYRSDLEGNYMRTLDECAPGLAARVRGGRREERIVGTADMTNFFRKPFGEGWALVGDAGYHKDPITAQGMTDAFRDAGLLAGALDDSFSGRRPLGEALAGYERRRNEAVTSMYELTCQLARLEPPPPETRQLFGALKGNQYDTDRFFGTIAGTVPIQEFYSPENVRRILGEAELAAA